MTEISTISKNWFSPEFDYLPGGGTGFGSWKSCSQKLGNFTAEISTGNKNQNFKNFVV